MMIPQVNESSVASNSNSIVSVSVTLYEDVNGALKINCQGGGATSDGDDVEITADSMVAFNISGPTGWTLTAYHVEDAETVDWTVSGNGVSYTFAPPSSVDVFVTATPPAGQSKAKTIHIDVKPDTSYAAAPLPRAVTAPAESRPPRRAR